MSRHSGVVLVVCRSDGSSSSGSGSSSGRRMKGECVVPQFPKDQVSRFMQEF